MNFEAHLVTRDHDFSTGESFRVNAFQRNHDIVCRENRRVEEYVGQQKQVVRGDSGPQEKPVSQVESQVRSHGNSDANPSEMVQRKMYSGTVRKCVLARYTTGIVDFFFYPIKIVPFSLGSLKTKYKILICITIQLAISNKYSSVYLVFFFFLCTRYGGCIQKFISVGGKGI